VIDGCVHPMVTAASHETHPPHPDGQALLPCFAMNRSRSDVGWRVPSAGQCLASAGAVIGAVKRRRYSLARCSIWSVVTSGVDSLIARRAAFRGPRALLFNSVESIPQTSHRTSKIGSLTVTVLIAGTVADGSGSNDGSTEGPPGFSTRVVLWPGGGQS